MTKFEQLIETYTKAENDFYDYKWKCIDFAKEIGINISNYLGCKLGDIQYYLYDKEGKPVEAHPRDALILKKDTFWHYGMGINMYMIGERRPSPPFIFNMAIKSDKNGFIVEFPQLKKEYYIDSNKPEDFKSLNRLVYITIKEHFENLLKKFLDDRSLEHYPDIFE